MLATAALNQAEMGDLFWLIGLSVFFLCMTVIVCWVLYCLAKYSK
jgi:hypothetical protein